MLVLILLVTTLGMTIDFHYCQHHLYDFSIFGKAKSCCLPDLQNNMLKHNHCAFDTATPNNCEDELIYVKAVDNYIASSMVVTSNDIPVTLLIFHPVTAPESYSFTGMRPLRYANDDLAPPLVKNPLSFTQSFLL